MLIYTETWVLSTVSFPLNHHDNMLMNWAFFSDTIWENIILKFQGIWKEDIFIFCIGYFPHFCVKIAVKKQIKEESVLFGP